MAEEAIMNLYSLNNINSKYIKQQLTELQGESLKSITQGKFVTHPFLKLMSHGCKKLWWIFKVFSNRFNKLLVEIWFLSPAHICFLNTQGTFIKIGYNGSLYDTLGICIIYTMLSEHKVIRLEMNSKKTIEIHVFEH